MELRDMDVRFTYHEPSEERALKHAQIREHGRTLAELIDGMVPEGREKSLAITKIEEAVMWANAALARSLE